MSRSRAKEHRRDEAGHGRACPALKQRDRDSYKKVLSEAGMSRRKAYYLVGVSERLAGIGLSENHLRRIGWWKLAIVARHLTKRNAKRLIALAARHRAKDLPGAIAGKARLGNRHRVLLLFSAAQYRQFASALMRHGASAGGRGLVNKEQAIMSMISNRR